MSAIDAIEPMWLFADGGVAERSDWPREKILVSHAPRLRGIE